jgi:hypothetical protein
MTAAKGSITRDGDYIVIRLPVSEVHGLRVALQPCPCKGAKSAGTAAIRDRLDRGLARAMAPKQKAEA